MWRFQAAKYTRRLVNITQFGNEFMLTSKTGMDI
jgi:hypothetical protein